MDLVVDAGGVEILPTFESHVFAAFGGVSDAVLIDPLRKPNGDEACPAAG